MPQSIENTRFEIAWGSRGRRFDSCHSDHKKTSPLIQFQRAKTSRF